MSEEPESRVIQKLPGKDELNLAEFPITLLGDRAPDGVKTLTFEDTFTDNATGETFARKLVITGSEAHGLPTAGDDDVIVGLIQLTRDFNNFSQPEVEFTRYELIRTIGWRFEGRSYARLEESLNRWLGVTLYYDRAWRDSKKKRWIKKGFHILDNISINDERGRNNKVEPDRISTFKWNSVVFASFQAGYLKPLDAERYFSLKLPISRRLYRYLDKYFYYGKTTFDLKTLAFEKVGISRGYDVGQIKRKLTPAIAELEAMGFIEAMDADERFLCEGRGNWKVAFRRGGSVEAVAEPPAPGPGPTEGRLIDLGMTAARAAEIAREFDAERIERQIRHYEWLKARSPKRVTNAGGWLARAIREDFRPPEGFGKAPAPRQMLLLDAEAGEKSASREAEARLKAHWESLDDEGRRKVEAEALKAATPEQLDRLAQPAMRAMARAVLRDAYLRRTLGLPAD